MHKQIVNSVEVVAKVVVKEGSRLVSGRIKSSDATSLLRAANTIIASRRSPVDQTIVDCASVWSVDWWVGEEFGKGRRVLVEIDDKLGKEAGRRSKLGKVELVLRRDKDWRFMNCT